MYIIMGKYKNLPVEELDETDSLTEANNLVVEYSIAFGRDWKVWLVKK